MYKWRINKLEIEEKQQEFKVEMTRSAVKFSELVKSVGRVDTERERDRAGTKIIEKWEHLVVNWVLSRLPLGITVDIPNLCLARVRCLLVGLKLPNKRVLIISSYQAYSSRGSARL